MGTDIHGVFQRHDPASGQWLDIESNYNQERHYQLFAVLAGVRNGVGFAGVKIGQAVTPISEPRDLPEDFAIEDAAHPVSAIEHISPSMREWHKKHEKRDKLSIYMGDHSHSWLTGDEMLGWYANAPSVVHTGILSRKVYEAWDGKSNPRDYCGGIAGGNVVLIHDNAVERELTPGWTHIRCEWIVSLRDELAYFFDEVARLAAEHGKIRFVFGFDS